MSHAHAKEYRYHICIVSREHSVKLTETYNTNKNLVKELHH